MSKKIIQFRCKTPNGPIQINTLSDQENFGDLKQALTNATGLNRLKVLHGYPFKELDLSKEDTLLGSYFKTSKESLIVSENVSSNVKDSNTHQTTAQSIAKSETQSIKSQPTSTQNKTSSLMTASTNYLTRISIGFNSDTGRLIRKIIPANNSCLFTAVYFCVTNGKFNPNIGTELRKIIADKVKNDPVQFNDAILGCPNDEYCKRILKDDVWGGSIELKILSDHYKIEIVAVDIQNIRLNKFGEDQRYPTRILLIYDGIHYDALYFELIGNEDQQITIFNSENSDLLNMALQVASEAKSKRQFTDTKNFKLKCLVCGERFTGSHEANQHASKTGHINFSEV